MAEDPSDGWLDRIRDVGEGITTGRDAVKALRDLWEWTRSYREKNWSTIVAKVSAILERRGISGRPETPAPRSFVQLVENASYEDDEGLQELWAGLIANSFDPAQRQQQKRIFIQILSSLEPIDAAMLKYACNRLRNEDKITLEQLAQGVGFTDDEVLSSLRNLARLSCLDAYNKDVEFVVEEGYVGRPKIQGQKEDFEIAPLAYELLSACEACPFIAKT